MTCPRPMAACAPTIAMLRRCTDWHPLLSFVARNPPDRLVPILRYRRACTYQYSSRQRRRYLPSSPSPIRARPRLRLRSRAATPATRVHPPTARAIPWPTPPPVRPATRGFPSTTGRRRRAAHRRAALDRTVSPTRRASLPHAPRTPSAPPDRTAARPRRQLPRRLGLRSGRVLLAVRRAELRVSEPVCLPHGHGHVHRRLGLPRRRRGPELVSDPHPLRLRPAMQRWACARLTCCPP